MIFFSLTSGDIIEIMKKITLCENNSTDKLKHEIPRVIYNLLCKVINDNRNSPARFFKVVNFLMHGYIEYHEDKKLLKDVFRVSCNYTTLFDQLFLDLRNPIENKTLLKYFLYTLLYQEQRFILRKKDIKNTLFKFENSDKIHLLLYGRQDLNEIVKAKPTLEEYNKIKELGYFPVNLSFDHIIFIHLNFMEIYAKYNKIQNDKNTNIPFYTDENFNDHQYVRPEIKSYRHYYQSIDRNIKPIDANEAMFLTVNGRWILD